jgi:hypothetical protein
MTLHMMNTEPKLLDGILFEGKIVLKIGMKITLTLLNCDVNIISRFTVGILFEGKAILKYGLHDLTHDEH